MLSHRIDHRDRVGTRLPLHCEHHGALVVEPARHLVVLDAVDDVGDFRELDRGAIAPGHDHLAVFLRPAHGIGSDQCDVLVGAIERADRRIRIGRREHPANIVERHVPRGRGHRIDLHAGGVFLRAIDLDGRDSRKLGDLLREHGLGVFIDHRYRQGRRAHGEQHHRSIGRIGLVEAWWRRHLDREPLGRHRQGGLHVERCAIHVAIEHELHDHLRATEH